MQRHWLPVSYMLWAHLVIAYMIYKLTRHLYSEIGSKRIMVNQEDKIVNLFINICFHSFKQDLLMLSSEIEVICIDVFGTPKVKAKEACGSWLQGICPPFQTTNFILATALLISFWDQKHNGSHSPEYCIHGSDGIQMHFPLQDKRKKVEDN